MREIVGWLLIGSGLVTLNICHCTFIEALFLLSGVVVIALATAHLFF